MRQIKGHGSSASAKSVAALHAELKTPNWNAESESQHALGSTFHDVASVGHCIHGLMAHGIVMTRRLPMQNHTIQRM